MWYIALFVLLGACAPTPGKVVLVGVDGASWKVLGPMIKGGELPTFARLKAEGASQTNFSTLKVAESPLVWTTVVTGVRPKRHGITDFVQTLDDGTKVQDTFPPELDASLDKYWLDPAAFPYDRLFAGARLNAVQEELARNAPFFERST